MTIEKAEGRDPVISPCLGGKKSRLEDERRNQISYNRTFRKRSEFVITDTELKLMAAAAIMGLSRIPKNG
jgi:homoaconitase/3-isopropylmalate dehydratase large subunit